MLRSVRMLHEEASKYCRPLLCIAATELLRTRGSLVSEVNSRQVFELPHLSSGLLGRRQLGRDLCCRLIDEGAALLQDVTGGSIQLLQALIVGCSCGSQVIRGRTRLLL